MSAEPNRAEAVPPQVRERVEGVRRLLGRIGESA